LPEVAVPDFPTDPAELAAFGYDLGWRYFYRVKLDESDREKTERYRARARIESERRRHGNPEEFLESLRMKATLARDSAELIGRNSQLSQKTNQFNLTLRRYTESDVRRMTGRPDCAVLSASLEDRFCDHGWTALAVLRADPECDGWLFDTFLVSCRVLGRGFEQRFATECIEHVRELRSGPVRAEYVPGPRNSQTADFFPRLGFRLVSEAPDGHRLFELGANEEVAHDNGFVEIAWRES
jgi:FkbH-like protein